MTITTFKQNWQDIKSSALKSWDNEAQLSHQMNILTGGQTNMENNAEVNEEGYLDLTKPQQEQFGFDIGLSDLIEDPFSDFDWIL